MGFCTFCGKEVAPGETCSCQQQTTTQNVYSAPQMNDNGAGVFNGNATNDMAQQKGESMVSPIIDNIKDTIKNPIDAADNYYKNATVKTSVISVAALAIMYILTSIFNMLGSTLHVLAQYKKIYKASGAKLMGMSYSEYLEAYGMSRGEILRNSGITGGTWVQSVFFPIVYMILMGVVVVGIVYLVNALLVKKQKIELINILKFVGAVSFPIMAALAVRFIAGFVHVSGLSNTLFNGLYVSALVVALIQSFELIKGMISDKKNYVFAMCIAVFGIVVMDYVIGHLFLGHFDIYFATMPHFLG